MEIKDYRQSAVIFIKMNPTDSTLEYPDIALFLSMYNKKDIASKKAIKQNVKQGDVVSFKATF